MNEKFIREILYFKSYYLEFFDTLKPDVKKKFNLTLMLIATTERIPSKFFKHIESSSGLYEIRVEFGSNIYRVFSFFDKGNFLF